MIPLKDIEKVAKRAGVDKISKQGLKELQKALTQIGVELAKEAANEAKLEKSKAISAKHVLKASGKA